jgi:hypothetical protein
MDEETSKWTRTWDYGRGYGHMDEDMEKLRHGDMET